MHHVAVVASKVQANGSVPEDQRRVRLLTWGKGSAGQLGISNGNRDCSLPQVVASLDGRRVLHVSCGGHHTMAVCEHDPQAARKSYPPTSGSMAGPSALQGSYGTLPQQAAALYRSYSNYPLVRRMHARTNACLHSKLLQADGREPGGPAHACHYLPTCLLGGSFVFQASLPLAAACAEVAASIYAGG